MLLGPKRKQGRLVSECLWLYYREVVKPAHVVFHRNKALSDGSFENSHGEARP